MDQQRIYPPAGAAEHTADKALPRATVGSVALYRAELSSSQPGFLEPAEQVHRDGYTGVLVLKNLDSMDVEDAGNALRELGRLMGWAQAQQARVLHHLEGAIRDTIQAVSGVVETGLAFSVAASEAATLLNIPQVTAQRLMGEAGVLCSSYSATLKGLAEGQLSYGHVQLLMEQSQNIPPAELPVFEADLLAAAVGQTRAQFGCRARRLRERRYPETIAKRHLSAFERRRVVLDQERDGMSCLMAYLPAAQSQQIFTALGTAARGERSDGDPRTTDQLRADILADLLTGGFAAAGGSSGERFTSAERGTPAEQDVPDGATADQAGLAPQGARDRNGVLPRAEIMVLINAETLFGADEQPAELHGYGPISAEAARRLARQAVHWTGLARNPLTGEILGVGRRRKVPAGLHRWLRARDGTCRFPGCRVNAANSEVDHTKPWSHGGTTDHGNLAHLCPRHHRFKTLGFWKAAQPQPGVMEWTSPTGRVYRTEPHLVLVPGLGLVPKLGLASNPTWLLNPALTLIPAWPQSPA